MVSSRWGSINLVGAVLAGCCGFLPICPDCATLAVCGTLLPTSPDEQRSRDPSENLGIALEESSSDLAPPYAREACSKTLSRCSERCLFMARSGIGIAQC